MEEITPAENIGKLAAALSKAQAKIQHAEKGRENPHFGHGYSTLADVWNACREALTENELAVVQMPQGGEEGWVCLETRLIHSSGESVASIFRIPVVKRDPQAYGSAITYARRYSLAAIVGVAPEDDDGNAAANKGQRQQGYTPQQRPSQSFRPPVRSEAPAESRGDAAATNGTSEVTRCSTENCGRPLTTSQKTAAVHKFGKPLCLDCQKTATPVAA